MQSNARLRAPSPRLQHLARVHSFELPSVMLHTYTEADETYVHQVDADAPRFSDRQLDALRALLTGGSR